MLNNVFLEEKMKTCFFVTPIGDAGSFDRERSDTLLNNLLIPVCKKHNIEVVRSDKIAVRHCTQKPIIHIAQTGQSLP